MPDTKIPQFASFLKNPIHVVAYVLLLYFVYREFNNKEDCGKVVAKYEKIIKSQDERITKLETYIDIKNGVIKEIEQTVKK